MCVCVCVCLCVCVCVYCVECMRCGIMRFDIRSGIIGPCDDGLIE